MKDWQKEYFFLCQPWACWVYSGCKCFKVLSEHKQGSKESTWSLRGKERSRRTRWIWFSVKHWETFSPGPGNVKHIHALQQLLLPLLQVWARGEGHGKGWWPGSAWEGCVCCRWLQVKQGRCYTPLGKPDASPGEPGASSGRKHSTRIKTERMCGAPPSEHVLGTGPSLPCGFWSWALHAQYRNSLVCGPGFGDEKWICSQEKSRFVGRNSVSWVPQGHSVWKSQMIKR